MSAERLFLDIHAIQVLPPSNVNRDDTGSPKTAQYGGVTRARVSSQAWKHAIREYFKENEGIKDLGVRTLDPASYIAKKIRQKDPEISIEESLKKSMDILKATGLKLSKNKQGNMTLKALFFLGSHQAEQLADAAIDGNYTDAQVKQIIKSNPDIDIALFGRMLADDPELNEDASSQVAHAISTHEIHTEYDYFTAEDDLQEEGNAGAAMLDTTEFDSSVLYRYANVAVHDFMRQMNNDVDETIKALKLYVEAFSNSMPSGKSNAFANQTLPQALLVILRDDRPVSLVGAYENPVKAGREGYVQESIKRMFNEENKVNKFVHEPLAAYYLLADDNKFDFNKGAEGNLNQLLYDLGTAIKQNL